MSFFIRKLFITGLWGFLGGVLVSSLASVELAYSLFLLLLACVFFGISFLSDKSRLVFLQISVVILFFVLGVGRVGLVESGSGLESEVGENVHLTGLVVAEPDIRDKQTLLILKPADSDKKVLVSTDVYQDFNYGDRVEVNGKLDLPANFTTDTGKIFDYVNYLKVRKIYYRISFAEVSKIESGQGNIVLSFLFKVKKVFIDKLNTQLAEPKASLMAGLLVGDRRGLGEDLQTDFRKSGLIHIIVLSGYNMTIIAESLIFVLANFLALSTSLVVGAVGIVLFALLTGGGATVFRASIMALLAIFARLTGRIYDSAVALFFAGSLMVLVNPLLLVFDVGFQLSFLATLGLIYLAPVVEKTFLKQNKLFGLKEILVTTISAQVAVLPWLVYVMGEISLVSLPVNILVLPMIPVTMFFGFITGVAGLFSSLLAFLPAVATNILLTYVLVIVDFSANLSLATLRIDSLSFGLVLILYLGLGGITFWANKKYQHN